MKMGTDVGNGWWIGEIKASTLAGSRPMEGRYDSAPHCKKATFKISDSWLLRLSKSAPACAVTLTQGEKTMKPPGRGRSGTFEALPAGNGPTRPWMLLDAGYKSLGRCVPRTHRRT